MAEEKNLEDLADLFTEDYLEEMAEKREQEAKARQALYKWTTTYYQSRVMLDGYYMTAVEIWSCKECGSMVAAASLHDHFHWHRPMKICHHPDHDEEDPNG